MCIRDRSTAVLSEIVRLTVAFISPLLVFGSDASLAVSYTHLDLTGSNSTGVSGAGDYAEAATPVLQFLGMNTRRESRSDPALRRARSAGIVAGVGGGGRQLGRRALSQQAGGNQRFTVDAGAEGPAQGRDVYKRQRPR